jgi:hypothetical protein
MTARLISTTERIDMKLATRKTYDAASAMVGSLEALLALYPGLAAQIRPSLEKAAETLRAASEADVAAYGQLFGDSDTEEETRG